MPLGSVALPTMHRVRQAFPRTRLEDIPGGVRTALAGAALPIKRGDRVAVGAGSRGIANIAVIVRATVDWLKAQGARPFVFPAMGSHGGATADGQRSVLEHYGITEATMGCEVRASMDVVQVGEALGLPIWLDRIASEADWIGVVNRIKPHTDFKGSIESGLFKMMTIGLGKYHGATQYHRANVNHGYETVITAVGREMLAKARIGFGLGIVENGYDETARVEAFNAADLEAGERRMLKDARDWMARLPFSPIDVLVVEEIGKNISGSGMDTNVIGRPSNPHEPFPADPKILWIVALDLTEESHGNATGIGNADFTTRRLAEKIDWKPTAINTLTACAPNGAKLPLVFESDREAVENALNCIGLTPPERARVIRIRSTLVLGEIECSEALLPEIAKRPDLTVVGPGQPLGFDAAGRINPLLAHNRCTLLEEQEVPPMIVTTRRVFHLAAALLAHVWPSPRPPTAQDKVGLIFSAGPTGGTWTPMAAATADVIKKKFPELDVQVEPGAALVNMEKIRNDKADIGWSMTTVLADARAGVNTWKGKQTDKPLIVANYYPNVWQLIVPADSDVRKLEDLKGKAVALPPRGNTSLAEGWELLLKVVGMKLDDLGTKSYGSITENGEPSRTGRRWRWVGTLSSRRRSC